MRCPDNSDIPFIDKVRDFNWDFSVIGCWFSETTQYHLDTYGLIYGGTLIFLVIVFALLHNDMTRPATSLFLNTLFRSTVGALVNSGFILAGLFGIWIKNQVISRIRYVSRTVSDLFK